MTRFLKYGKGDLARVHLSGFSFGTSDYESPFSSRFKDYQLLPYIDLFSDDARKILFKESFWARLIRLAARRTKLTEIANKLVGTPVFKTDDKQGLIEELAELLILESEEKKTLSSRIETFEKHLAETARNFRGISRNYDNLESSQLAKAKVQSGTIISVEAVLNRVSAISSDQILKARREEAGVKWLLSDFPFFLMGQHNDAYDGETVALRFPDGLAEAIGANLPLTEKADWYPYVKVVGVFQEHLNAKFPGISTIDVRWMRIRRPRNPSEQLEEDLASALKEGSYRRGYNNFPFYLADDRFDALFVLYLMLLTYHAENATFDKYSETCAELSHELLPKADPIPKDLKAYYAQ